MIKTVSELENSDCLLFVQTLTDEQVNNIREWVEALESGEYAQTDGALRHTDGYCCLGVECDLYAKKHEDWVWNDSLQFMGKYSEYDGDLPIPVQEYVGLATEDGQFNSTSLVDHNDTFENTFPEIAAVIREQFKRQFGVDL